MTTSRVVVRGLLLVCLIALAAWLLRDVVDRAWIDAQVRNRGIAGQLLFLLVACLLMSVGLSRQLVALLAGYGFGFAWGLLLSMAALVAACMLTFTVARVFLRDYLLEHFSDRIQRIHGFIQANTFVVALLFRLAPLGSNWMVNVAAGASGVPAPAFFAGSAIGYTPQMIVFALIGSGTRVGESWQLALAVLLAAIALWLGVRLYRRYHLHAGHPV